MPTPRHSNSNISSFAQTNAFAMQHGLIMGLYVIVGLGSFVSGLTNPVLSLVATSLFIAYPFVASYFTFRFRKVVAPSERFTIFRGFSHSLLTMFYAAIWAAIATFVYMQFFDHGYLSSTLLSTYSDPKMQEMMKANGLALSSQGGGEISIIDVIKQLQQTPPAAFAETILYMNITTAPIVALIIGLFTMRIRPRA